MNQVTKLPINPSFAARYTARTGFSLDDPDRKVPVHGHPLAQMLAPRTPGHEKRSNQLLQDRNRDNLPSRARALAWLTPLGGILGWPERAQAHCHHPPLLQMPQLSSAPNWHDWLAGGLAHIAEIDLGHPIFGLAIGGALLMTQIIGIRQRGALLGTVLAKDAPQLDLFPETLTPDDEDAADSRIPLFTWESDTATRQGQVRKENQDAVLKLNFDDGSVVLIVCDGAGGIEGGREASQSAVDVIGSELQRLWAENAALAPEALLQAITAARVNARNENLSGVTTALVLLLQADQMHYATLGDGAVAVVWPDGMVGQVQVPHHTAGEPSNIINAYIGHDCDVPPRTGSIRLEAGAIVMAMTDGASDLFPFEDFALNRDKYPRLAGLADRLLLTLEEARDLESGAFLHTDNLTLAMARLTEGGRDDEAN
jgi:hypothetical protein